MLIQVPTLNIKTVNYFSHNIIYYLYLTCVEQYVYDGILFLDAPNSGYSAEINRLGDESSINYEFVLRINNVTKDIASKTIYMSAKENTGPSEEGEETSPR